MAWRERTYLLEILLRFRQEYAEVLDKIAGDLSALEARVHRGDISLREFGARMRELRAKAEEAVPRVVLQRFRLGEEGVRSWDQQVRAILHDMMAAQTAVRDWGETILAKAGGVKTLESYLRRLDDTVADGLARFSRLTDMYKAGKIGTKEYQTAMFMLHRELDEAYRSMQDNIVLERIHEGVLAKAEAQARRKAEMTRFYSHVTRELSGKIERLADALQSEQAILFDARRWIRDVAIQQYGLNTAKKRAAMWSELARSRLYKENLAYRDLVDALITTEDWLDKYERAAVRQARIAEVREARERAIYRPLVETTEQMRKKAALTVAATGIDKEAAIVEEHRTIALQAAARRLAENIAKLSTYTAILRATRDQLVGMRREEEISAEALSALAAMRERLRGTLLAYDSYLRRYVPIQREVVEWYDKENIAWKDKITAQRRVLAGYGPLIQGVGLSREEYEAVFRTMMQNLDQYYAVGDATRHLDARTKELIASQLAQNKAFYDLTRRVYPYVAALSEQVYGVAESTEALERQRGIWWAVSKSIAQNIMQQKEFDSQKKKVDRNLGRFGRTLMRVGWRVGFFGWILMYSTRMLARSYQNLFFQFRRVIRLAADWQRQIENLALAQALATATGHKAIDMQELFGLTMKDIVTIGMDAQAFLATFQATLFGLALVIWQHIGPAFWDLLEAFHAMIVTEEFRQFLLDLIDTMFKFVRGALVIVDVLRGIYYFFKPLLDVAAEYSGILGVLIPALYVLATILWGLGPILTTLGTLWKFYTWWTSLAATKTVIFGLTVAKVKALLLGFIGVLMIVAGTYLIYRQLTMKTAKDTHKTWKDFLKKTDRVFTKSMAGMVVISRKQLAAIRERFAAATEDMLVISEAYLRPTAEQYAIQTLRMTDSLGNLIFFVDRVVKTIHDASGNIIGYWDEAAGTMTLRISEVADEFEVLGWTIDYTEGVVRDASGKIVGTIDKDTGMILLDIEDVIKGFQDIGGQVALTSGDVIRDLEDLRESFDLLGATITGLAEDVEEAARRIEEAFAVETEDFEAAMEEVKKAAERGERHMFELAAAMAVMQLPIPGIAKALAILAIITYEVNALNRELVEATDEATRAHEEWRDEITATEEALRKLAGEGKIAYGLALDLINLLYMYPEVFYEANYELLTFIDYMYTMGRISYTTYEALLKYRDVLEELCFAHAAAGAEMFTHSLRALQPEIADVTEMVNRMQDRLRQELEPLEQQVKLVYEGEPLEERIVQIVQQAAAGGITQHITIPITLEIGTVTSEIDLDLIMDEMERRVSEAVREGVTAA